MNELHVKVSMNFGAHLPGLLTILINVVNYWSKSLDSPKVESDFKEEKTPQSLCKMYIKKVLQIVTYKLKGGLDQLIVF